MEKIFFGLREYFKKKRQWRWFILLVIVPFSLLSACSSKQQTQIKADSYGTYCSRIKQENIISDLSGVGKVNTTFFGDKIYLKIAMGHLFDDRSVHLQGEALNVLDVVAKFLRCYQKISIEVVGYTNIMKNKAENIALSEQQAQKVANYLWHKGVKARLIYAKGGGETSIDDVVGDRRIEIITTRLP